jgi:putative DNA primase/helicase
MTPTDDTRDDFTQLIELAQNPQRVTVTSPEQLKEYKRNTAVYLLAGTLLHETRKDDNFTSSSLLLVDFDSIPDEAQFLANVKQQLDRYQYVLYPSISYGQMDENGKPKGARYHLAMTLSHPLAHPTAGEPKTGKRKPLTYYINTKLGMKSDDALDTWSQLFGAPTLTNLNAERTVIHPTGGSLDVDAIVDWYQQQKPAQKPAQATQTPQSSTRPANEKTKQLPDKYVHDLLTEWTLEHPERVADELGFAKHLMLLLNCQRAGEISEDALEDAMKVFAQGDAELAAGNLSKLEEHRGSSNTPNLLPFRSLFQTLVPVYLVASEDDTYTATSIKLSLITAARTKRQENDKHTLTNADIADVLLANVPMYADWDSSTPKALPLLQLYNAQTGIYDGSSALFNSYVDTIDRNSTINNKREVYAKLLSRDRVPDGEDEANGDLIPAHNGVINTQDGSFTPYRPKFHFTSKIATNYVPDLKTVPMFTLRNGETIQPVSLLQSMAGGEEDEQARNQKLIQLLEVIGDACQPNKSRQQATWLLGKQNSTRENGSNGKSTFLDIVSAVVGAQNVATLTVDEMAGSFALEQVPGKSVIIGDDVQAGMYIKNSANYNSLTTGGLVKVEGKGRDAYSYRSRAGVIQATNELPKFANQTGGTNRRMHIITFNAHIDASQADERIKSEFIPSKAFRECVLWLAVKAINGKDKFTETDESRAAAEQFAKKNDTVSQFMNEVASQWHSVQVPKDWAYAQYTRFCADNGYKQPKTSSNFVSVLQAEYGFGVKRSSVSVKSFPDGIGSWTRDGKSMTGIQCLVLPVKVQEPEEKSNVTQLLA